MNATLTHLENKRLLWRASQHHQCMPVTSSGFSELDDYLYGGFPERGVIDITSPSGIGELRLLLPNLLARQQHRQGLLVFIAPPMALNSEMLAEFGLSLAQIVIIRPDNGKEALWSAEQCLKSACCHSVLLWQQHLNIAQLKRLQLAADTGNALHIILRQQALSNISLPVNLGLTLHAHAQGIEVQINKRKGGARNAPFTVSMAPYWPRLSLTESQPASTNIVDFPLRHYGA